MLRVSSGKLRGRRLLAPEGELKPTSDKVRQAVFNIFRPHIFEARFLDLFAGSGSVGITALSEGASFSAFVEHDPRTYRALRQNCLDLELPKDQYSLHKGDALKLSSLFNELFDIIFADPFYPEISHRFVKQLHKEAWALLAPEGFFLLEHGSKLHHEDISSLDGFQWTKRYGDTSLTLFQK